MDCTVESVCMGLSFLSQRKLLVTYKSPSLVHNYSLKATENGFPCMGTFSLKNIKKGLVHETRTHFLDYASEFPLTHQTQLSPT